MDAAVAYPDASPLLHSRFSGDGRSSSSSLPRPQPLFASTPEPSIKSRKFSPFSSARKLPKLAAIDMRSVLSEKVGYRVHTAPCHEPFSVASVPDLSLPASNLGPTPNVKPVVQADHADAIRTPPMSARLKPVKPKTFLHRITSKLKLQSSTTASGSSSPPPAPVPHRDFRAQREAALREVGLRPAKDLSHLERELDERLPSSKAPEVHAPGPSAADLIKQDWEVKNRTLKAPPDARDLERMRNFRFGSTEALSSTLEPDVEAPLQPTISDLTAESNTSELRPPPAISDDGGSIRSRQNRPPPLDLSKGSKLRSQPPSSPPPNLPLPPSPGDLDTNPNLLAIAAIPLPPSPQPFSSPTHLSVTQSTPSFTKPSKSEPHLIPLPPSPPLCPSPRSSDCIPSLDLSNSHGQDIHGPDTAIPASPALDSTSIIVPSLTVPSLSTSHTISTISSPQSPSNTAFSSDLDLASVQIVVDSPVDRQSTDIPTLLSGIDEAPEIATPQEEKPQEQQQKPHKDTRQRIRRETDSALVKERKKNNRTSLAASLGTLGRSIVGTLNGRAKTRPASPSPRHNPKGTSFNTSHLPPSPSIPSSFTTTSPPPTPKSPMSPTFKSRMAAKPVAPPPVARRAISPTVHSRASILFELETMNRLGSVDEEESRRLSEMAFLG